MVYISWYIRFKECNCISYAEKCNSLCINLSHTPFNEAIHKKSCYLSNYVMDSKVQTLKMFKKTKNIS